MNKLFYFGEIVPGIDIRVLNEREIRAAAGILFVLMLISVITALRGDFIYIKYTVTVFLADIAVRVFMNPKFSPFLIIGRLITGNQNPEYVSAKQKKFAWIIGVILGSITFTNVVILNAYSPVSGIICLICLVFLFFESAFGICLGCKFYLLFFRDKAKYCPGEICSANSKQEIQKVSGTQYFIISGFFLLIIAFIYFFSSIYNKPPYNLFSL